MSAGTLPAAEIVIACHSAQRNLSDAVDSVLRTNSAVRVRLVAHNIEVAQLVDLIDPELRSRVTAMHLADGTRSPAGPFQRGMDAVRAPVLGIMGSDDVLEAGAVDHWREVMARTSADLVLARLRREESPFPTPTPPVRATSWVRQVLGRPRVLDPVRDRLVYRSAPLGLCRTAALRALDVPLTPGLTVGEDVDLTTQLVLRVRTVLDAVGPAYVVRDSATDRTTLVIRPLDDQLAFVPTVLDRSMTSAQRHVLALKLLRIHVFSLLVVRDREEDWPRAQREALARWTRLLLDQHRDVRRDLSRAEETLVRACLDTHGETSALLAASRARRRHGSPPTVLPAVASRALSRQGAARTVAASALSMLPPGSRGRRSAEDQQGRSSR